MIRVPTHRCRRALDVAAETLPRDALAFYAQVPDVLELRPWSS